jgi:hypothetical protein
LSKSEMPILRSKRETFISTSGHLNRGTLQHQFYEGHSGAFDLTLTIDYQALIISATLFPTSTVSLKSVSCSKHCNTRVSDQMALFGQNLYHDPTSFKMGDRENSSLNFASIHQEWKQGGFVGRLPVSYRRSFI